jgi:Peptidase MA superfamily
VSKMFRLFLFLGSLLYFRSLFASSILIGHAQSPIVVTNEGVTTSFPDSITFSVDAQSAANIEKATLIYGTNGRSCQTGGSQQTIDFELETAVSLEWEWELKRSGSLPPGTAVWWQWEIEDAVGNQLLTERQELPIEDARFSWDKISDNGITVYWIRGNESFGQEILNTADTALDRLSDNMGIPRPDSIDLWIYPTAEDVQDALVYSSEWAGGVAFPDYGISIIGVAPGEDAWQSRVIPHELTHLVVGVYTFNCRGVRLPTWLNEGLARYAEDNVAQRELDVLEEALANGRLPSLRSLASGFSAYGGDAGLAYTQSYQVVQYLVEQYGAEQMTELLTVMQSGLQVDEALERVYGFDSNGLDAAWRGTTGYAATPTSAADALAAEATPTVAPTLALVNPLASSASATPQPSTPTAVPTETAAPTETAVPREAEVAVVPEMTPTSAQGQAVSTPEITTTAEPVVESSVSINWLWAALTVLILLFILTFMFIRHRRRA